MDTFLNNSKENLFLFQHFFLFYFFIDTLNTEDLNIHIAVLAKFMTMHLPLDTNLLELSLKLITNVIYKCRKDHTSASFLLAIILRENSKAKPFVLIDKT